MIHHRAWSRLSVLVATLSSVGLLGCSSSDDGSEPGAAAAIKAKDSAIDGLYRDFLDGKYDAAGHPLDAEVWQAEAGCAAETGKQELEGRGFSPDRHDAGVACSATTKSIGLGGFTLNVQALVYEVCNGSGCNPDAPVLTLTVRTPGGNVIESSTVAVKAFQRALTYQSIPLKFTHSADGPVEIAVTWEGAVGARVDYVELFRSTRNLLLTPPSGVLPNGASFGVEIQDPPADFELAVRCDELELDATLATLLASGKASRSDTEFRSLYQISAADLLASCPRPTRVRFSVMNGAWAQATSRVTVMDAEPPCTFTPGATRVLLTGFEPFPASSSHDNSSEQAVSAFDPADVPGISLMRLTLPVEFDTAPGILAGAIQRCSPDVVIGFGQGRSAVDLETTAYNRKDSSEIAGGVPDNRGLIPGGEPVVQGGPPELSTGLPVETIKAALEAADIAVGYSDDPGRYVCNNLFYRIMTESSGTKRVSGFVHLPYIHTVDDADRAKLKRVVTEAVSAAVQKQRAL